jgi:hypothetical protein
MLGSAIHITPAEMRDGWASLQHGCSEARARLQGAHSATAVAESWTALSAGRLTSLATMVLHRVQRLNRMTAACLLTSREFGLFGDKDVDTYRIWRIVPYTNPAQQVLRAVAADIELLRLKSRELNLDLRAQIGEPGGDLPRRLCLFFGLDVVSTGPRDHLRRTPFKRGHVQAITKVHFGRPANIGRHFFVSSMAAASTDAWLIAAATGHGHVGAEVFSDSMAVAPSLALGHLKGALNSIVAQLALVPVPGGELESSTVGLAACAAPSPSSDPYLVPRRGSNGRILPPAADTLTLTSLVVVGRVEALLTTKASIPELGAGESAACLVTLDGIHPSDLLEAQAQMSEALGTTNLGMTLTWTRIGCAGEINQPLCVRTVLAVYKAKSKESVCSDSQMRAAGQWIRTAAPEVIWPKDDRDVFLAYCALAQRWHRFHEAPGTMAAASRAIFSASANRESVLRLADSNRPKRFEDLAFTPVRTAISKERVQLRSALVELKRALGTQGNTRARLGEEQKRSRALLKAIQSIDVSGDLPALRAREVLEQECRSWLDDDLRNSKAGRQYSSLRTYGTQVFAGLELLSTSDDISLWIAPDFTYWFSRVRKSLSKADDGEDDGMDGVRRFLLVGRDRLGWDVPDELLRGLSPFMTDGQRKAAAATVIFSFDYDNARRVIERRLAEWPLLLEPARIDLGLRRHPPLRAGERATLASDCLTAESGRVILKNAGFSDKKSPSAVRLCTLPPALAADIRRRGADRAQSREAFLFLDKDGNDWSVFDSIDQVENEALTLVTGDPSYRPHSCRAAAGCNFAWPEWEAAAEGIFQGRAVSASPAEPETLVFNRIVGATVECGQGHVSTFLTYYASIWPILRAISANARLRAFEPDDAFVAAALGTSDAVRTARSRAMRSKQRFSAWDVIGRVATQRCGLPALERKQPMPVVAPVASPTPAQDAIAKYVLARTTGTPRDEAALRCGIAISLAKTIDLELHRRKQ